MTIFLPNFNFKMLLFHCGKLPRGQKNHEKILQEGKLANLLVQSNTKLFSNPQD